MVYENKDIRVPCFSSINMSDPESVHMFKRSMFTKEFRAMALLTGKNIINSFRIRNDKEKKVSAGSFALIVLGFLHPIVCETFIFGSFFRRITDFAPKYLYSLNYTHRYKHSIWQKKEKKIKYLLISGSIGPLH